ncbi:Dynactin subunit 5 [Podila verticillata]|nr:Dynactin subunit 5 [Podila verticillata]
MKIGDHVTIGEGTIVQAATIGSFVKIGKNCVISTNDTYDSHAPYIMFKQGRFAIIKDCCRIEDNTVIPPNSVVPSFSVYKGSPGKLVDELPESIQDIYEAQTKDRYSKFVPSRD